MENNKNFDDFLGFLKKYKGAIIGGLIAIVIACTGLWKLLIAFAVIIAGFRFELKNTSLARDNDFKKDNLDFFLAK